MNVSGYGVLKQIEHDRSSRSVLAGIVSGCLGRTAADQPNGRDDNEADWDDRDLRLEA